MASFTQLKLQVKLFQVSLVLKIVKKYLLYVVAGWILSAIAILQIPIWGFIGLRKQRGSTTAEVRS